MDGQILINSLHNPTDLFAFLVPQSLLIYALYMIHEYGLTDFETLKLRKVDRVRIVDRRTYLNILDGKDINLICLLGNTQLLNLVHSWCFNQLT